MAQYERNFTLEPDEPTWVDADYDDVNYTFKLVGGNLKPDTSTYEGVNYHRVVYTGESVDRTADSIYVEVTLGDGPSVYFDQGGPGWFINDASADQGKGYFLNQNGNSFSISRVDTNNSVGTNIGALGSHTTATGGKVGLEIYQINTSARIRAYYDDVVIGSSIDISADNYADKVVPGLSASYQNNNARGWTAIAIDGLDLGGFSLTDINGTGVIQNNDAIAINGDFASTTITSVTLSQSGATDEVITSITETDTQLTLAAIDFHTTDFMDGELTVTVTDGTTSIPISATLDFSDDWLVDTAVSVDSTGMWKDIVGAVGTPVWSNAVWTATTETPEPPGGATDLTKIFWAPSFNGVPDGASMENQGLGAFWEGGVADHSVTLNGEVSARQDLWEGQVGSDNGSGNYIGIGKGLGSITAGENSEVWMRWYTRQESGFSWDNGDGENFSGRIKAMRFEPSSYSATRKVEVQLCGPRTVIAGTVDGSWIGEHEGIWNRYIFDGTDNYKLDDEKWEQWEAYCKGAKSSDGEWKIWRNGVQVGLPAQQQTWRSAEDSGQWESVMFMTYWNAGVPKDQTFWYCRPAVAMRNANRDDTPFMSRDADGFPIIGMVT